MSKKHDFSALLPLCSWWAMSKGAGAAAAGRWGPDRGPRGPGRIRKPRACAGGEGLYLYERQRSEVSRERGNKRGENNTPETKGGSASRSPRRWGWTHEGVFPGI
jgi:hypothetical protein